MRPSALVDLAMRSAAEEIAAPWLSDSAMFVDLFARLGRSRAKSVIAAHDLALDPLLGGFARDGLCCP
jgi:hypothetical protein